MIQEYSKFRVWVEITPMSEGLRNSLRYYASIHNVNDLSEVEESDFRAIRGNGQKRWEEFIALRSNLPERETKI